jgi:flavin reductase (DIM6/NTAB) family NADH-FMN oxidoreductase RutF
MAWLHVPDLPQGSQRDLLLPMMRAVEQRHAYLLLNHGPVSLITSAHGGARNVMAASWVMPLDFDPPKLVAVLDKATRTRQLIDRSGVFGVNLPTRSLASQVLEAGHVSALALPDDAPGDKIDALGLRSIAAHHLDLPLIEGCVAWLECRVIPQPQVQVAHDLFMAEVVVAWADERVFSGGRWLSNGAHAPRPPTIHYVAGGQFFDSGSLFEVDRVPRPHPVLS